MLAAVLGSLVAGASAAPSSPAPALAPQPEPKPEPKPLEPKPASASAPKPAPASNPDTELQPLTLDTPLATFDAALTREQPGQGLGLQLEVLEPSGFIVVDGVLPNGIAAKHGGIAPGDVLISVGANKVVNKSFDDVRALLQETAQSMELHLVFGRRA